MRIDPRAALAAILVLGLSGCGSNSANDSEPPPGHSRNEKRNTAPLDPKKGKSGVVNQMK